MDNAPVDLEPLTLPDIDDPDPVDNEDLLSFGSASSLFNCNDASDDASDEASDYEVHSDVSDNLNETDALLLHSLADSTTGAGEPHTQPGNMSPTIINRSEPPPPVRMERIKIYTFSHRTAPRRQVLIAIERLSPVMSPEKHTNQLQTTGVKAVNLIPRLRVGFYYGTGFERRLHYEVPVNNFKSFCAQARASGITVQLHKSETWYRDRDGCDFLCSPGNDPSGIISKMPYCARNTL